MSEKLSLEVTKTFEKKIFLVVILICFQLFLIAQDYKSSFGLRISPGISSRTKQPGEENLNFTRYNLTGGVEFSRKVYNKGFIFDLGILYFDRGYKLPKEYWNRYIGGGPDEVVVINKYIMLPTAMRYKFRGIYVGSGLNINYYLSTQELFDGVLVSSKKSENVNDFLLGAQIMIGFEQKLNKNFAVSIDAYANVLTNYFFENYGLGLGFKYLVNERNPKENSK